MTQQRTDCRDVAIAPDQAGEIARERATRGAASGCCERPWTLPDGKTLLVGSSYNAWWYYIDGATGKVLGKLPVPESPVPEPPVPG